MIGLSTTVFGGHPLTVQDWKLLASHGFTEIELALGRNGFDPPGPEGRAAMLEASTAAGVRFTSVSVALNGVEAGLVAATELGSRLLVARAGPCHLHPHDPRGLGADRHALERIIEPFATAAESAGVTLAVEFPGSWPSEEIVDFLEAIDAPAAAVCLDLGHAHMREGAPDTIEQLAGYIATIHLHDNLGRSDDHRLPFSGAIEWPAVLMEFEKTGYTGPLVLEVAGEPDAAAAIARAVGARTRLQAILDDLAQPMVFPE